MTLTELALCRTGYKEKLSTWYSCSTGNWLTRGEASWGIESVYNDDMTGIPGRTSELMKEMVLLLLREKNPVKGNKLVTTLDAKHTAICRGRM